MQAVDRILLFRWNDRAGTTESRWHAPLPSPLSPSTTTKKSEVIRKERYRVGRDHPEIVGHRAGYSPASATIRWPTRQLATKKGAVAITNPPDGKARCLSSPIIVNAG